MIESERQEIVFITRINATAYLIDTFSESEKTMISLETKKNCTIFKVTGEVTADEILFQLAQYMRGERTDTAIWEELQETHRVRCVK